MNKTHPADADLLALTANIVAAHVGHNIVSINEVSTLIAGTFNALVQLGRPPSKPVPAPEPAVPIKHSVKADHIVCLEDGRKLKMLKRHLMIRYDMTPQEYRAKWSLPASYPMVAPDYAARRRALALEIGLGTLRAVGRK